MKKYVFTTLTIFYLSCINGQTTVWLEDFSGYPNGTQQNAPTWTTFFVDTDDPQPHTVNGSYWGTYNGEFRCNDIEGPGNSGNNTFTTRFFSISAYTQVSVRADYRGTGGLDANCGPGCLDFILFEYSINGGAWTQWALNGYIAVNVPPDPLPLGTASSDCLSGDSIAIRITMGTMANDENYFVDNIEIIGYNTSSVDAGPDMTVCAGQGTQLSASGGSGYIWSGAGLSCTACPSPMATPGTTTTYYVQGIGQNGCPQTDSVTVTIASQLAIDLGNDTTLCPGQGIALDAGTPGGSYQWNDGSQGQFLTVTQPGLYWVQVNLNGCTGSDTIMVTQETLPVVDLGPDLLLCGQQSVVLLDAGNTGATFLWNDNSVLQTLSVNISGTYSVIVTNLCGSASDQVNVVIGSLPQVSLGADFSACDQPLPAILDAGVHLASIFMWNTGETSQQIQAGASGTYWVTVTNACGMVSDTVVISPDIAPVKVFNTPVVICGQSAYTLDAENPGAVYQWNTGETSRMITVSESGNYIVDISLCGNTISDTATVEFLAGASAGPFIPNTFTPNGDGINDFLEIGMEVTGIQQFKCRVFNRWGTEIFNSDNPFFKWDGMYRGEKAAEGTYYITVYVRRDCAEEQEISRSSYITLVR